MYVESFTFDTQLFSLAIMHSLERAEHKIPLILPSGVVVFDEGQVDILIFVMHFT